MAKKKVCIVTKLPDNRQTKHTNTRKNRNAFEQHTWQERNGPVVIFMTLDGNWWTAPLKEEVSNKDILRNIFTYSRRLFETFLLKHTQAFAIYRLFGKAGRKIRLGSIIRTQHTSLHKHNTCTCVYKNTINVCIYMFVWYIYTCRGNFKKMKCIRIFFLQRINLKIEQ